MDTHVKVLGVLHIAMGALGLIGALLLILFGGAAGIVGASGDPDAAVALPIIGITGTALVVFVVALSLPGVIIGIGLVQFRSWARIGGLVLSIFDLIGAVRHDPRRVRPVGPAVEGHRTRVQGIGDDSRADAVARGPSPPPIDRREHLRRELLP